MGSQDSRRRRRIHRGTTDHADVGGATLERAFRDEYGRILATLIRVLEDFDLAEECLQDAAVSALDHWRDAGPPANPGAWLTTAARNRAIDVLRRRRALDTRLEAVQREMDLYDKGSGQPGEDDRLRLIFTCCHPALNIESQVALTLRTLGGLATPEVARAFLMAEPAMAQRLVRAKTQDPRRSHPLPGSRGRRPARAPRRGAGGAVPRLQ